MRVARLGLVVLCASLHPPVLAQARKPPSDPVLPPPPPPVLLASSTLVTPRYDAHFQKYTKRFFGPGYDWRLFKAQSMAESNLNPNARSWVGARGPMQLMPRTVEGGKTQNPDRGLGRHDELNIAAGIAHARQEWERRTSNTPHE